MKSKFTSLSPRCLLQEAAAPTATSIWDEVRRQGVKSLPGDLHLLHGFSWTSGVTSVPHVGNQASVTPGMSGKVHPPKGPDLPCQSTTQTWLVWRTASSSLAFGPKCSAFLLSDTVSRAEHPSPTRAVPCCVSHLYTSKSKSFPLSPLGTQTS